MTVSIEFVFSVFTHIYLIGGSYQWEQFSTTLAVLLGLYTGGRHTFNGFLVIITKTYYDEFYRSFKIKDSSLLCSS